MDRQWEIEVSIPKDLDEVIQRGIRDGKQAAARRRRVRKLLTRSVGCAVLALGIAAGGIRLSPAFAEAVGDLPVLGELVQIFGQNQPLARGGGRAGEGTAVLTMGRDGETEWFRLEFSQADASWYQAGFASCPKTVTITLPGTEGVSLLPEISGVRDASRYIKSVWQLPGGFRGDTTIQLELEHDADVQIQEYREPGGLVIRLTPCELQTETVYSVRTLSMEPEELEKFAAGPYETESLRVLRDDSGACFLEFGQYAAPEEAQKACRALEGAAIVEVRTGNNVPVCFRTMEDYESSCLLNQYARILHGAEPLEHVLDFLDQHFAAAGREAQEVMLAGLSGLLEGEEPANWERAASFYRLIGREPPSLPRRDAQSTEH